MSVDDKAMLCRRVQSSGSLAHKPLHCGTTGQLVRLARRAKTARRYIDSRHMGGVIERKRVEDKLGAQQEMLELPQTAACASFEDDRESDTCFRELLLPGVVGASRAI